MKDKILELLSQLETFSEFQNTTYLITETFRVNGERTYKLTNLKGEIEKGVVYFSDENYKIYEYKFNVLMAFRINSVIDIKQSWEQNKDWTCIIKFKDGSIKITRINPNIHN